MNQLVVKRSVFCEHGISLDPRKHYQENSTDQYLIELIILKYAEWLPFNKSGDLIGYDSDVHVKIGCRLALNQDGEVKPEDIFHVGMVGNEESTIYELIKTSILSAATHSGGTHTYDVVSQCRNGWVTSYDEDNITTRLCLNFLLEVTDIVRNYEV